MEPDSHPLFAATSHLHTPHSPILFINIYITNEKTEKTVCVSSVEVCIKSQTRINTHIIIELLH